MSAVALRPRSVPELVDATVRLLRLHYLEFVTISAIFLVPVLLLSILSGPTAVPGQLPSTSAQVARVFLALPALGLGLLGTAAVVVAVSDSYVRGQVDVGAVLRRVFSRAWSIVGALVLQILYLFAVFIGVGLVSALAIGGGAALGRGAAAIIVVPVFLGAMVLGLLAYARVFAAPMVVVLEGTSAFTALSRSFALTKGSAWRVVGVLLLAAVIVFACFGAVFGVLAYALTLSPRTLGVLTVVADALNVLVYPLYTVFMTLLYYDLRIRKEGYDLEVMAKELGVPASAPAVAQG